MGKDVDFIFLYEFIHDRIYNRTTMTISEACKIARCSPQTYNNHKRKAFEQIYIMEKKKRERIEEPERDVNDFPMITIVGRREVINGKVCHVYPSRMNF
jgi:hypothetical protein